MDLVMVQVFQVMEFVIKVWSMDIHTALNLRLAQLRLAELLIAARFLVG